MIASKSTRPRPAAPALEWKPVEERHIRQEYTALAGIRHLRIWKCANTGRWHLDVDRLATTMPGAQSRQEVEALVDEAVARGGRIEDAIEALVDERGHAAWLAEVLDLIMGGREDAPGNAASGEGRGEEISVNVEAIATELRRRGFEIDRQGHVHETWKDRAEGTWIPQDGTLELDEPGDTFGSGLVRIEDGHVLEVVPDASGERGDVAVEIDGRRVAAFPADSAAPVEEAKCYALRYVHRMEPTAA